MSYDWSERLSTDLELRWEAFESTDWALDDVVPDTVPTILTTGAAAWDYDIWAVGISFRYRVGGNEDQ